jgi:hypothetical protein
MARSGKGDGGKAPLLMEVEAEEAAAPAPVGAPKITGAARDRMLLISFVAMLAVGCMNRVFSEFGLAPRQPSRPCVCGDRTAAM